MLQSLLYYIHIKEKRKTKKKKREKKKQKSISWQINKSIRISISEPLLYNKKVSKWIGLNKEIVIFIKLIFFYYEYFIITFFLRAFSITIW